MVSEEVAKRAREEAAAMSFLRTAEHPKSVCTDQLAACAAHVHVRAQPESGPDEAKEAAAAAERERQRRQRVELENQRRCVVIVPRLRFLSSTVVVGQS